MSDESKSGPVEGTPSDVVVSGPTDAEIAQIDETTKTAAPSGTAEAISAAAVALPSGMLLPSAEVMRDAIVGTQPMTGLDAALPEAGTVAAEEMHLSGSIPSSTSESITDEIKDEAKPDIDDVGQPITVQSLISLAKENGMEATEAEITKYPSLRGVYDMMMHAIMARRDNPEQEDDGPGWKCGSCGMLKSSNEKAAPEIIQGVTNVCLPCDKIEGRGAHMRAKLASNE
jgi:hypothetical protein